MFKQAGTLLAYLALAYLLISAVPGSDRHVQAENTVASMSPEEVRRSVDQALGGVRFLDRSAERSGVLTGLVGSEEDQLGFQLVFTPASGSDGSVSFPRSYFLDAPDVKEPACANKDIRFDPEYRGLLGGVVYFTYTPCSKSPPYGRDTLRTIRLRRELDTAVFDSFPRSDHAVWPQNAE